MIQNLRNSRMAKKRRKKKIVYDESELEEAFLKAWMKRYPKHMPALQHRFHPTRKFRFDFAWPTKKVAVEIQGYGPGHFSLLGATKDYDRLIECLKLNWRVIYFTNMHLSDKRMLSTLDTVAYFLSIPVIKTPTNTHKPGTYIPKARR